MTVPTPTSEAEGKGKGFLAFWTTLPGILTGVAAVLTAIVGLITVLHSGSSGSSTASPSGQASVTTSAATQSTPSPVAGVLAQGRLAMTRGDSGDLERGVIEISTNSDVTFGPEVTPFLHAAGTAFLAPTQGPASKGACTTALGARHDAFESLPRLDTKLICVSTNEGHVAVVRIVSLPGVGSAQLVLESTVWQ